MPGASSIAEAGNYICKCKPRANEREKPWPNTGRNGGAQSATFCRSASSGSVDSNDCEHLWLESVDDRLANMYPPRSEFLAAAPRRSSIVSARSSPSTGGGNPVSPRRISLLALYRSARRSDGKITARHGRRPRLSQTVSLRWKIDPSPRLPYHPYVRYSSDVYVPT